MKTALLELIAAARNVEANWSRGDLAAAVNELRQAADLAELELRDPTPTFREPAIALIQWETRGHQQVGHLRGIPGTTIALIEAANPAGDVYLTGAFSPDRTEDTREAMPIEHAKEVAEFQLRKWFREATPILAPHS